DQEDDHHDRSQSSVVNCPWSIALALAPRGAAGREAGIAARPRQASCTGVRPRRQAEQAPHVLSLALGALDGFVAEHQHLEVSITVPTRVFVQRHVNTRAMDNRPWTTDYVRRFL